MARTELTDPHGTPSPHPTPPLTLLTPSLTLHLPPPSSLPPLILYLLPSSPHSTLISSYPKFLQKTAGQRPDSVLVTLPKKLTWTQWTHKLLHSAPPIAAGSVIVVAIIILCALKHYGLQEVAASWLRPSSWMSSVTAVVPVAGSIFVASAVLWALKRYSSHIL